MHRPHILRILHYGYDAMWPTNLGPLREVSQNNDDDENYNVIGGQLLSKRGCG